MQIPFFQKNLICAIIFYGKGRNGLCALIGNLMIFLVQAVVFHN